MDILVIPDPHSNPDFNNDRFDWLSNYIIDTRPDIVLNLGDSIDLASLAGYDKGKRSFFGKSYKKDIDSHAEAQERWWGPIKARKKKMPRRIILEGNHEHRIEKALDLSPELEGTLRFEDFRFDDYYDEVVRYNGETPGTITIQGVTFAHYLTSGVLGRPISGEHPAHALISKLSASVVVGHSHLADYCIRSDVHGKPIQSVVAGCYFDYDSPWAGKQVNQLYWRGLVRLNDVQNGRFDPQWISLDSLRKAYGNGGR